MKKVFLMLVLLGMAGGQASAEILGTGTNTNPEIGSTAKYLTINGNKKTVLFYTKKRGDMIAIAFNAECSVKGVGNNKWANVNVMVNGTTQSPSSGDNAFCTDHNNNYQGNWISGVTNVVFKSTKIGWNTVRVRANMAGSGTWRFDDKSVIVWN